MLEPNESPMVRSASADQQYPEMPAESGYPQEQQTGGISLATALKNRWRLVILVWLLICGPGLAFVWSRFDTEYRAEGIVRLAPMIPRVVFSTENNGMVPLYSSFLTTQMQLITNEAILNRAVDMPGIRSLPCFQGITDPARYLSASLKIENPLNSELISVSYGGTDPKVLAPVVNSVLKAYMEQVIEQDQSSDLQKLEALYKKQSDLEQEVKERNDELYNMATEFGTLSLDSQQDTAFASVREMEIELKRAQAVRVSTQARLEALKTQGPMPISMLDLAQIRAEILNRDPELLSLGLNRQAEEHRILQSGQQLGPGHRENKFSRERLTQFDRLIAAREKVLEDSVAALANYRATLIHEAEKQKAQHDLIEATQRENAVQEILQGDLARATVTGRNAVQLQAVRERVDQSKQLYRTVLDRIQSLEVEKQRPARVTVVSWASEPLVPARDKRSKLSILVVAGSLFMAFALAVFVDSHDTSLRCEEDVRRNVGLNLLGTRSMPGGRQKNNEAVLSAIAEEIRGIRGCILFAGAECDVRSVLITSPNAKEGKTQMTGDLAVALAESGRRVLAIDADNYKRDLSRTFGFEGCPGLSEYLANGHDAADFIQESSTPGLWLLPSGTPQERFNELLVRPGRLEEIKDIFCDYDIVLVDAPPVLVSSVPGILAKHVDAALMILRSKLSSREDAVAAKAKLSQMGGRIIGAVLNGVQSRGGYYQRYGYYQHS